MVERCDTLRALYVLACLHYLLRILASALRARLELAVHLRVGEHLVEVRVRLERYGAVVIS